MVRKIKRRRPSGGGDGPIDHDAIAKGTIPWSLDELQAVLDRVDELYRTPHDDWDRRPQRFTLVQEDGSREAYRMNPDKPMNQIMGFIVGRCREQHLSTTASMAHGIRFMEILEFIRDHQDRLDAADLLLRDQGGDLQAAPELLEVLATSRFTRPKDDGYYTFDPDDVIIEAGRRKRRGEEKA